jgi:hypothetical protein
MDNTVRKMFGVSKEDYLKEEARLFDFLPTPRNLMACQAARDHSRPGTILSTI